MSDQSKVQRSQTTGWLMITAPKANISEIEKRNMHSQMLKDEREKREKLKQIDKTEQEAKD